MCFVWISEQTAIISLYSINWLVFVTETGCVYCAVRTEYFSTRIIWNEMKAIHRRGSGSIRGHSMSDLWWTKCHSDRYVSQYLRSSSDSIIPPMLRTCLHTVLTEGQAGECWEPQTKQCSLRYEAALHTKVLSHGHASGS